MSKNISRLTKKSYWFYGLGVSYFIIDQLYNQWLQYYYLPPNTEKSLTPLLKPQYLIIAFIFARLIDAVSDPVVGYLSDNSKSKFGKRSFFMMIGGIPLGLLTIMYFYPVKSSQIATLVYLSIVGGLYFTAYTLVAAPYNALIPDLANTKEERLNLSTVQSTFRLIFTGIAMVLPGILIAKLGNGNTEAGIRKTVILLTVLAILGIYLCIFFLKEKDLTAKKEKKRSLSFGNSLKYIFEKEILLYFGGFFFFFSGFNILRGVLTYYLTIVMGRPIAQLTLVSVILFGVAGLFFPITNKWGKKYSYKKILILDIAFLMVGSFGLLFITKELSKWAYLMFVICGIGLSGSAFIFPQAMLSEISAEISERKKVGLEGFLFGIQGLFLKLSFLVQQVAVSIVIVFGSQKSVTGLKTATDLGVRSTLIVAFILFGISLFFYNLKKED
ncbi:MFS transporter [Leptotrichia sp.]|uniref:MFS transporter n=1 Tax=Leptotrichia sp. TaxID=104608 RepID=UPI00183B3C6C|nr:MFS transporter [Leptotrichia sp.]MBB1535726.1 MFS transporter [Leptotrichia sp.]